MIINFKISYVFNLLLVNITSANFFVMVTNSLKLNSSIQIKIRVVNRRKFFKSIKKYRWNQDEFHKAETEIR